MIIYQLLCFCHYLLITICLGISAYKTICLLLSAYHYLCITICLWLYFVNHYISMTICLWIFVYDYVAKHWGYHYLWLSVYDFLSMTVFITICLSLSVCDYLFISVYLSLYVYHHLSYDLFVNHFISMTICISPCVYNYLFMNICLLLFVYDYVAITICLWICGYHFLSMIICLWFSVNDMRLSLSAYHCLSRTICLLLSSYHHLTYGFLSINICRNICLILYIQIVIDKQWYTMSGLSPVFGYLSNLSITIYHHMSTVNIWIRLSVSYYLYISLSVNDYLPMTTWLLLSYQSLSIRLYKYMFNTSVYKYLCLSPSDCLSLI